MRKIIVDYKKLNNDVLDLLVAAYPDGYDDEDIISFRNAQGEIVDCVRVSSDDTIYLVKVSKRLVLAMEDHEVEDEDDTDDDTDFKDSNDAINADFSSDDHEDYDDY